MVIIFNCCLQLVEVAAYLARGVPSYLHLLKWFFRLILRDIQEIILEVTVPHQEAILEDLSPQDIRPKEHCRHRPQTAHVQLAEEPYKIGKLYEITK